MTVASARVYPVTVHATVEYARGWPADPNVVWNVGRATLTTVISRIDMMAPSTTTPAIFRTPPVIRSSSAAVATSVINSSFVPTTGRTACRSMVRQMDRAPWTAPGAVQGGVMPPTPRTSMATTGRPISRVRGFRRWADRGESVGVPAICPRIPISGPTPLRAGDHRRYRRLTDGAGTVG